MGNNLKKKMGQQLTISKMSVTASTGCGFCFRHLVLLGCSCTAPSHTRSQAPEYAKWPKMAYSARIMPQSYILLGLCPNHIFCSWSRGRIMPQSYILLLIERSYYARNSARRCLKAQQQREQNIHSWVTRYEIRRDGELDTWGTFMFPQISCSLGLSQGGHGVPLAPPFVSLF